MPRYERREGCIHTGGQSATTWTATRQIGSGADAGEEVTGVAGGDLRDGAQSAPNTNTLPTRAGAVLRLPVQDLEGLVPADFLEVFSITGYQYRPDVSHGKRNQGIGGQHSQPG